MKLYFSPWGVDNIIPVPAVVGDAVEVFESCIEKMFAIPLGTYYTLSLL